MTTSNEHNNAPAVPQGYPVLPDYVEDAIERCKSMPGHPPAWVDMMRSMRKALGATTPAPAPAPAQGDPFGYFRPEPFGWTDCSEDADGAIALYEHPAQPAQEVGLTDAKAGRKVIEIVSDNITSIGADGLVCPDAECACRLGELAPCDGDYSNCQPGWISNADAVTGDWQMWTTKQQADEENVTAALRAKGGKL